MNAEVQVPRAFQALEFEDVVGTDAVVRALRQRVKDGAHHSGLILHGPAGAGKLALARIYANATMCEAPTANGSPCLRCAACEAFAGSGLLDLVQFDGAVHGSVATARELLEKVRFAPAGDWRIVIIENADALLDRAFDALLKTLEEPPSKTSFVLITNELKRLRVAGQSRCKIFRVGPTDPARARTYLEVLCNRHGAEFDVTALDLIARACR
jgi:DNA polymerase-3 subunit gamma/tau